MRALIQRVSSANVCVNEIEVANIAHGLLVLLAVEMADEEVDIIWLANKIIKLRVFDDANNVPNLSVNDVQGQLLVVSQFTLYACTKKGNRPSYVKAAMPDKALLHYQSFLTTIAKLTSTKVQAGVFGANMKVQLVNHGPLTLIIDSKNKE